MSEETAREPARRDVDVENLHDRLRALGSPVRLRILGQLRKPKSPSEIRVQASDSMSGYPEDRILSRSTVHEHLKVLESAGLVRRVAGKGTYVVDQQHMVKLIDQLGELGRIEPSVRLDVDQTVETEPESETSMPEGPKLVLVNGPRLGESFALEGTGPWTLGREETTDVALTYDPHVSRRHLIVRQGEKGMFEVEALEGATNPARLDFDTLAPATPQPLVPGSVISVGSSRLVFKAV